MALEALKSLLEDLGRMALFPLAAMRPNQQGTCAVPLPDGSVVKMELDEREQNFLIVTVVGNVPTGRYRENLFREALKANGKSHPRYGTFAFSSKTEHFLLFESLGLKDLTSAQVAEYFPHFLEKAALWRQAVNFGNVPVKSSAPSIFGMGKLLGR